jgi:hypothetical protein
VRRVGFVAQSTRLNGSKRTRGVIEAFELGDDLGSEQQSASVRAPAVTASYQLKFTSGIRNPRVGIWANSVRAGAVTGGAIAAPTSGGAGEMRVPSRTISRLPTW